jgi:epoxyqueuosine reductase
MPAVTEAAAARIRAQAFGLGFDLVGFTALGPVETAARLHAWLAAGHHGEMGYLATGAGLREDTTRPEPGMRSAIVVALDYGGREPSGPVARYARGDDYHDVLRSKLRALHALVEADHGGVVAARPYVDTGPILERDLARRAGLGWFGKNTMLINPELGSFFFIGALFVALDLPADTPFAADHCGTCTRCLDACPTDAFVAPRVLDATRCLSYLTIEHRSDIPAAFHEALREQLYGCDICQDVCPWNRKFAAELREPAFAARELFADSTSRSGTRALAREILMMEPSDYAAAFKGSAIKRAKLWMLKRNACVLLGNIGTAEDLAALEVAGAYGHEVVRTHARWAIARVS